MNLKPFFKLWVFLMVAPAFVSCSRSQTGDPALIYLRDNWLVQSSALVKVPGSVVSGNVIDTAGWYHASVPSTIMGVLTGNGLYPDIFVADSLKKTSREPFTKSWWYRKVFDFPGSIDGRKVMLKFDGINYYANIWMNSRLVASRDSVTGAFRTFSFDITDFLKEKGNVLAVEVFRKEPGDFTLGFVDWNPAPPDDNMGIWREVSLQVTGAVSVENTWVRTDRLSENLDEASISVITELVNHSSHHVRGELTGKSTDFSFSKNYSLKAGERKKVVLTSNDIKVLNISSPKLWWCNGLGEPNLYNLDLQFNIKGKPSDIRHIPYGIRTVQVYRNEKGHKGFILNGKKVLIRGAGWTDDIFLRDTRESKETQVRYVKDMNLNTIRFESFWGNNPDVYSLCDRYGLLVMVGWSCQWEWDEYLGKACDDFGGIKSKQDMDLVVRSLGDQIHYLQSHPSIIVWFVGSDKIPRPELEKRYKNLISSIDNREYLAAASWKKSEVSGTTGMKMNGPYDYVGPSYWYVDTVNGGAFGFNTETGPGPQIPVKETVMKMIPSNKLWPLNDSWNTHCNPSVSAFNNLNIFNGVLQQRYGYATSLDNYLLKADVQGYEAMAAMYEAFRVNRDKTTGIVQWMLNSAWPSFYWQLYDYYLLPTSAYYAAKKANAPLQCVYNFGDHGLYMVNETLNKAEKLSVRIKLTDLNGKKLLSEERVVSPAAGSSEKIFSLPSLSAVSFLSIKIVDSHNNEIACNFYWLSPKPDEYAWDKTEWYYTPMKASADFRALNYMPAVPVEVTCTPGSDHTLQVKMTNNSEKPAFFIHLALKDKNDHTLFPVFWNDNYISLLPGESRLLTCNASSQGEAALVFSGWNVKENRVNVNLQ